jgi:hypothetical protein
VRAPQTTAVSPVPATACGHARAHTHTHTHTNTHTHTHTHTHAHAHTHTHTHTGLPKEAVREVYKAAITRAGATDTAQHLSNGFVAALTQVGDDVASGQALLDNLLAAMGATIKASGCDAARQFATGVRVRRRGCGAGHGDSARATPAAHMPPLRLLFAVLPPPPPPPHRPVQQAEWSGPRAQRVSEAGV